MSSGRAYNHPASLSVEWGEAAKLSSTTEASMFIHGRSSPIASRMRPTMASCSQSPSRSAAAIARVNTSRGVIERAATSPTSLVLLGRSCASRTLGRALSCPAGEAAPRLPRSSSRFRDHSLGNAAARADAITMRPPSHAGLDADQSVCIGVSSCREFIAPNLSDHEPHHAQRMIGRHDTVRSHHEPIAEPPLAERLPPRRDARRCPTLPGRRPLQSASNTTTI
jgi:hypothetical protein